VIDVGDIGIVGERVRVARIGVFVGDGEGEVGELHPLTVRLKNSNQVKKA
jgi:hypothetical protein